MALVLLFLLVHAFIHVSLTHQHPTARDGWMRSALSIAQDDDGDSDGAPGSNGDLNCLSCRLHRNFISDLQHALLIAPKPLQAPVYLEAALSEPRTYGPDLVLSDRAPPLV